MILPSRHHTSAQCKSQTKLRKTNTLVKFVASGLLCAPFVLPVTAFGFGLDVDNLSDELISGPLNGPQDAAADTIQGPDDGNGNNRPAPNVEEPAGLCPDLLGRELNDRESQALRTRCTELILSAHPGTQGGGEGEGEESPFELGIGDDAIRSALQQIVPEETEILGAGATDTSHDQLANIGSRLQFLRTGSSTLPIAGIHSGSNLKGGMAGDGAYSRWGFFINGSIGEGEKDETFNENGFDFDGYGITAGMDFRFNENFVAGFALGYADSEVDIDDDAGGFDTEGESAALYALFNGEHFYTEATVTYGSYDYDGTRNIAYGPVALAADSDTEGDQVGWSIGAGYSVQDGGWNYNFYGRAEGLDVEIDEYSETGVGNTEWLVHVDEQEIESLQAILGIQAAFASSQSFGVIQPYASLEAHHEFEDDAREVTAYYLADPSAGALFPIRLTTDEPDEDFFVLTFGMTFVFKGGTQLFFNYDTVLELDDVNSQALTVGLRLEL